MKKRFWLITLVSVMVALTCLGFVACTFGDDLSVYQPPVDDNKDDNRVYVDKLEVVEQHTGSYVLGEAIDLSEIKIKVSYSDGKTEVLPLTDTMLSAEDRDSFNVEGAHSLTINYGNKATYLQISVKKFSDIKKFNAIFHSLGGSAVDSQYTDVILVFETPYRENYNFMGWYPAWAPETGVTGNRVIAPYTLDASVVGDNKDVHFYAKWEDKRQYTVKFLDIDDTVVHSFVKKHGESIDITDLRSYPAPPAKVGKEFANWTEEVGETYQITTDVVVRAVYRSVQCLVNVEHLVKDDTSTDPNATKITVTPKNVDYGAFFDIQNFVMPTNEGHQSRWVVYLNDETKFYEWDSKELVTDGSLIKITANKVTIKVFHQINTYNIAIHNGKATQEEGDKRTGDLKLFVAKQLKSDYKSGLAFVSGVGVTVIEELQEIYGYNAQWCIVTTDENKNEIWRNFHNLVWNENLQKFVAVGDEAESNNFDVTDIKGKKLCTVRNGNIIDIQGDFVIKPKYIKNTYTVQLFRNDNQEIRRFDVKYYTKFSLYDPSMYEEFSTWEEVKEYYLLYNIAGWLTESKDFEWATVEWGINWYTNPNKTEANLVDFEQENGSFGIDIKGGTYLYSQDIDYRRYSATFLYKYDFLTHGYHTGVGDTLVFDNLKQSEEITIPKQVTELTYKNNYRSYSFAGWYDYPYDHTAGKYKGNAQVDLNKRTRNVTYYAHYKCDTTYVLTINDKTQKEAYQGLDGFETGYDVADGSMVYVVGEGESLTSDMLFKGLKNPDGSFLTGQKIYEKFKFIDDYQNIYRLKYISIINRLLNSSQEYPAGTLPTAQQRLDAIDKLTNDFVAPLQKIINDYYRFINDLHNYDYNNIILSANAENLSPADYYSYMMSEGSLTNGRPMLNMPKKINEKLGELHGYNTELAFLEDFETLEQKYNTYSAENASGQYKDYNTSSADLNLAKTGSAYEFAGWYIDSSYETPLSSVVAWDGTKEIIGEVKDKESAELVDSFRFTITKNITLYAKWVDKLRGSEGLVFQKIVGSDFATHVIVVGYVNNSQYKNSEIFANCGYNFTNNSDYSINLNDQDSVPNDLGKNISLQIPAQHGEFGGKPYKVVGIMASAFALNGNLLNDISIPSSVQFVEENAFENCSLSRINYTKDADNDENNYLYVDQEKALYQRKESTIINSTTYSAGKLLTYASKNKSTEYTVIDPDSVTTVEIAPYAFSGASYLTKIITGDRVVSIGEKAFYSCSKMEVIESAVGSGKLPNSLVDIGREAFAGCIRLDNIQVSGGSALANVGAKAFESTKWFLTKKGVVILNSILVGVCKSDRNSYSTDGEGKYILSDRGEYILSNGVDTVYINGDNNEISRIIIQSNFTTIAEYALAEIANMTEIEINASILTSIRGGAFAGCSDLSLMKFSSLSSENMELTSNTRGEYDHFVGCSNNLTLIFPGSKLDAYRAKDGWSDAEVINKLDMMGLNDENVLTQYYFHPRQGAISLTLGEFIKEIGDSVFANQNNLTGVTLPKSLKKIGNNAFQNCGLTSLIIPGNVTQIGFNAFGGCNALRILTTPFLGESLTPTPNTNLGYIFGASDYSTNVSKVPSLLSEIILTENILGEKIEIANNAVYGLNNLLNFRMSANVINVGNSAFSNCNKLGEMKFPDALTSIGDNAFKNCSALNTLEFGVRSQLKTIGSQAFDGCGMTKKPSQKISLNIPKSVTEIGFGAFSGWEQLEALTVPFIGNKLLNSTQAHLGYIFGSADADNNSVPNKLTKVVVSENNTNSDIIIGEKAFYNLSGITSVNLPSTAVEIGARAFMNCTGLTAFEIPNRVITIEEYAFGSDTNLCDITFADGSLLESMGNYAFADCYQNIDASGVNSLKLPNSVVKFGRGIMENWKVLHNLITPYLGMTRDSTGLEASLEYLTGANAKASLTMLNKVVLTDTVNLRKEAFANWTQINILTLSDNLAEIEGGAFRLSGINEILVGGNVNFINYSKALYSSNKSQLVYHYDVANSYETPNEVTEIKDYAFANNSTLKTVIIKSTVTKMGYGAFYKASALTGMTLPFVGCSLEGSESNKHFGGIFAIGTNNGKPDFGAGKTVRDYTTANFGVKILGGGEIVSYAFYNMTNITALVIPTATTVIGLGALEGCISLTELTLSFVGNSYNSSNNAHFGYIFGQITVNDEILTPSKLSRVNIINDRLNSTGDKYKINITANAFKGMSMLTTVNIRGEVGEIGQFAFRDCTALTALYLNSFVPPNIAPDPNSNNFFMNTPKEFNIRVPQEFSNKYRSWTGWSSFESRIVAGVL